MVVVVVMREGEAQETTDGRGGDLVVLSRGFHWTERVFSLVAKVSSAR